MYWLPRGLDLMVTTPDTLTVSDFKNSVQAFTICIELLNFYSRISQNILTCYLFRDCKRFQLNITCKKYIIVTSWILMMIFTVCPCALSTQFSLERETGWLVLDTLSMRTKPHFRVQSWMIQIINYLLIASRTVYSIYRICVYRC